MSKKKDKRPDRRTILAVAAAGAAVPLIAASVDAAETLVPRQPRGVATKVVVDLGGVLLPEAAAKALEADIRRDVLTAVAKAGFKANMADRPPIGPGWIGLILKPQDKSNPH